MKKKYIRKHYPPATDGEHVAVCIDVWDDGVKQTRWGERERIGIAYRLDEVDKTSGQPIIQIERANWSLHSAPPTPATLYKRIMALTGAEPKLDKLGLWDGDSIIGRSCRIVTKRVVKQEQTYSNVTDVKPVQKGDKPLSVPLTYERMENRTKRTKTNGSATTTMVVTEQDAVEDDQEEANA